MDKSRNETPAGPKPASKRDEPGAQAAAKGGAKDSAKDAAKDAAKDKTPEIGGPKGPEPTRFGDWERGGICVDF